ncbi:MAG: MaoC/PaaZ C-terminal domain-containing protein [Dehalococcoidia bacterium]|nr:MaoC/PaaZ C-terminal domain-containing protein [Dehalococcoidia bacterium]
MTAEYFEDVKLHDVRRSREYLVEEQEIIDFGKKWDPALIHTDPVAARETDFKGLVASGIHLMAICTRLANESQRRPSFLAGLGWDEIRITSPARPGDRLVAEMEMISKRDSKSNPNAGVVRFVNRLVNQKGEVVITFKGAVLMEKRLKT